MKKILLFTVILSLLFFNLAHATEMKQPEHYVSQHQLSVGQTVVVAEGDFEPRSIGSYSVRIYGANPEFPTDEFLFGTIQPRDGFVEEVIIQDINGDSTENIIVIIRSAGTGGYLSADAFQYRFKQLELIATVSGLNKNDDPIQALVDKLQTNAQ